MSTSSWLAISPAAAPPIPSQTAKSAPCWPTERFCSMRPRAFFVRSATRKLSSLCSRIWPTSVRAKSLTRISPPAIAPSVPPPPPPLDDDGGGFGISGCVKGGPRSSCGAVGAADGRVLEVEAKELLANAELIAALQTDLVVHPDEGAVRGAEVGERETARAGIQPDDGVPAGEERVVGEDDVAPFATEHRLGLAEVEHVASHPFDGALHEARVPRRRGRTEEERPVIRRHAEPLLRAFHNLKP